MDGASRRPAEQEQVEPGAEERGTRDEAQVGAHAAHSSGVSRPILDVSGGRSLRYPGRVRSWRVASREVLFSHRLFELRREELVEELEAVATRQAYVLEAPRWVNVIALLPGDEVLLVRQWRFGVAATTLEIPGGMVEEDDALAAAARELVEETGYRAGRWTLLGEVEPNPAFLTNRCLTYLAEDLVRVGEPEGDGEEELELARAPLAQIPELIRRGEIRHSLVIAAFYLFDHRRRA